MLLLKRLSAAAASRAQFACQLPVKISKITHPFLISFNNLQHCKFHKSLQ